MPQAYLSVKVLKDDGSNWAIYKFRNRAIFTVKGIPEKCLKEDTRPPKPIRREEGGQYFASDDLNYAHPLDDDTIVALKTALEAWQRRDNFGICLLYQSLSDAVLMELARKMRESGVEETLFNHWTTLCGMYENRSDGLYTRPLYSQFLQLSFNKGGDVRRFVDKVTLLRLNLAALGKEISDEEFLARLADSFDSVPLYRDLILDTNFGEGKRDASKVVNHLLKVDVLQKTRRR